MWPIDHSALPLYENILASVILRSFKLALALLAEKSGIWGNNAKGIGISHELRHEQAENSLGAVKAQGRSIPQTLPPETCSRPRTHAPGQWGDLSRLQVRDTPGDTLDHGTQHPGV